MFTVDGQKRQKGNLTEKQGANNTQSVPCQVVYTPLMGPVRRGPRERRLKAARAPLAPGGILIPGTGWAALCGAPRAVCGVSLYRASCQCVLKRHFPGEYCARKYTEYRRK